MEADALHQEPRLSVDTQVAAGVPSYSVKPNPKEMPWRG
jgi:hypothetical protein